MWSPHLEIGKGGGAGGKKNLQMIWNGGKHCERDLWLYGFGHHLDVLDTCLKKWGFGCIFRATIQTFFLCKWKRASCHLDYFDPTSCNISASKTDAHLCSRLDHKVHPTQLAKISLANYSVIYLWPTNSPVGCAINMWGHIYSDLTERVYS